jgi:glutathione synthase/RimK-type ligase-like ATP-grasp enzyme
MSSIRVAVGYNPQKSEHSTNWKNAWIEYCELQKIDFQIIDCYQSDIIRQLGSFSHFVWHFDNYDYQDMLFARSILQSAQQTGLTVFPNPATSWHFDDKVAETYVLQSINAPIPESTLIYRHAECVNLIRDNKIHFPVIAKLRCGSGSHNVTLIRSAKELMKYSERMFTKGFDPSPSLMFKTLSNAKSSKNWQTFVKRIRRAPEFLRTLRNAKQFPHEKNYVFLQKLIPNDGYDLKIVVVGDKLSYIGRNIRKGEFRASGGGSLFYDKSLVTKNIIDSAFRISDELGFQCMGYDYVVNNTTGEGIIVEISYGFSHQALLAAGGYFDRAGNWHDQPLNAPFEILKNLIQ